MSEFTYACPVCHQHLKCDTSQAGTVMKCPTCYQRIVAPQAPSSSDGNLVFTGHRYVERKTAELPTISTRAAGSSGGENSGKKMPVGIIVVIALVVLIAGVVAMAGAMWKRNNHPPTAAASQAVAPVTFLVNMSGKTTQGSFRTGDTVLVSGSWDQWSTTNTMTATAIPSIYSLSLRLPVSNYFKFRFVINPGGNSLGTALNWEVLSGGDRWFQVPIGGTNLPPVYFCDQAEH